jgi:hypothetical protein
MGILGNIVLIYFFVFIVGIIIWLILRHFVCWYYKINERVELQKRTNELLEILIEKENNKESNINRNGSSL